MRNDDQERASNIVMVARMSAARVQLTQRAYLRWGEESEGEQRAQAGQMKGDRGADEAFTWRFI